MGTADRSVEFRIGDTVIEPSVGICTIQGIRPMLIDGLTEDYFIFQAPTAKVLVPRSQLGKRGIRRPMSKDSIRRIFMALREPAAPQRGNTRIQYLEYQEILRSGNPLRIARLLRNLFLLNQHDELKGKEKEVMEAARKFLVDEITFIREEAKSHVNDQINEALMDMCKRKTQQDKQTAKKSMSAKPA